MKINKIKNAYIKNKPDYNYEITDEDGAYVAKGHLLNAKLKLIILKHMKYKMDDDGQMNPNIESYILFSAAWILASIDEWIISLKVDKDTIYNLELDVLIWLVQLIQLKNDKSILDVLTNEKN